MPWSAALEPGSGSVTPSLTSNWRAFWARKKAFSAEIDNAGAPTIGFCPPRCRAADTELSLLAAVRDGMGSSWGGEVEPKARRAGRTLMGNVKAPGQVPNGKAPAFALPIRAYAALMRRLCESTGVALEFICGRGQIGGADQKTRAAGPAIFTSAAHQASCRRLSWA